MSTRRTLSSSLSARVVAYLRRHGHTQVEIARMLGVSEPYISLVKSKDRGFTLDHLELLAQALSVPLGVLLMSVTPPPAKASKRVKELFEISARVIEAADATREAILRGASVAAR